MLAACLAVLLYTTPAVTAQQKAVSLAGTRVTNSGGYYEYVPPSYAGSNESFPLLIFIHGIGELGNGRSQLPRVLRNGVPALIDNGQFPASFKVKGKTFSFIVVSPQFKNIPSPADLLSFVNYLKSRFRIDNKRIYVTGMSMGGGVAEDFASANDSYAKIPAAVVAIAGNMNPRQMTNAPKVIAKNDVPVWFLHNERDPVVPSQYSKDWIAMIDSYKPGPDPEPKLTIFNTSGHNAWSKAYDPSYKENGLNIYEWMLQYEQGGTGTTPNPPTGGNKKVIAKNNIGNGMWYPDAMSAFNLNPGDTLCIAAGDYEFIQLGNLVGTAAKPIVITNCGGVVRTGIRTLKSDVSFGIMGGKFLHIDGSGTPGVEYGFDINGRNLLGIKMQGVYLGTGSTDIDIHNFYIHDVASFIVAKTTQDCDNPQFWEGRFVMKDVKIHHIKGRYADYEGFYIGNTHYTLDYLFCKNIKSHHIQDLEVYENDLQYMGQDAIQVSMADLGENKIHHNLVRYYGRTKVEAQSYGLLMGGGSRVKVYNNVVDNGYMPGIALFGSGISYVYNNIISNVENAEGINVSDKLILEPVTAYIYNNTIYNTGNTGIKIYAYLTTIGHKVYNNLVIQNSLGGSYPTEGIYIRGAQNIKFDYGNNLFSTTANAAKVVSSVGGGDFHLVTASTAIDAGVAKAVTDMGLTTDLEDQKRPVNNGFDVGAYEYQGPKSPTPGNKTPTANAGKDITITLPTNTVTLNGAASADADGSISKYEWKKLSGPASGNIATPTAMTTTIAGLTEGSYEFSLTVTDDDKATSTSTVTVKVNPAGNKAPVANAGSAVTITLPISTVTLDGEASNDADGKIANYAWKKESGPAGGVFATPSAAKTNITGLTAGTYVFSLTVTDDDNAAATARVTVTVNAPSQGNMAPVANAGPDVTITLPENIALLDGSLSRDPDGKIVRYAWHKISGPNGGTIKYKDLSQTNAQLLIEGTFVLALTVTDDNGATDTDTMNLVVKPEGPSVNTPPIARAGEDVTIRLPVNSVVLNAASSYDPDGIVTKYQWLKVAGRDVRFSNATGIVNVASELTEGTYEFELYVMDNRDVTASDRIKVTVLPAENSRVKPPVSMAQGDLTIQLPVSTMKADASRSYGDGADISSYGWKQVYGPTQSNIASPGSVNTAISGLTSPGSYVFELTVTDDKNQTSRSTFEVTVLDKGEDGNAAVPEITAYPNPVVNTLNIQQRMKNAGQGTITIFNMTGMAMKTYVLPASDNIRQSLDVSSLPVGTYILQVVYKNSSYKWSTKFIKAE
jgi:parallel beta-helix repeat protein